METNNLLVLPFRSCFLMDRINLLYQAGLILHDSNLPVSCIRLLCASIPFWKVDNFLFQLSSTHWRGADLVFSFAAVQSYCNFGPLSACMMSSWSVITTTTTNVFLFWLSLYKASMQELLSVGSLSLAVKIDSLLILKYIVSVGTHSWICCTKICLCVYEACVFYIHSLHSTNPRAQGRALCTSIHTSRVGRGAHADARHRQSA